MLCRFETTCYYNTKDLCHANRKNVLPAFRQSNVIYQFSCHCDSGGDATRLLPRDGGIEELYGDPTVGPRPKVWTRGQNGSSGAEDGAPERLGCGTVKEEVNQILQRVSAGAA